MTEQHSIEVTAYFGDLDTYHSTHRIGPYPTAADRDHALRQLAALPGNHGDATFAPTTDDRATADHTCTPDQVATIRHFQQVVGALYGYEVGDDGEEPGTVPCVQVPVRRRPREWPGQISLFNLLDGVTQR